MSLVELMVGMAIGLIGIVIITHLYLTNEDYKRSTAGAGTAQTNGAIALYTVERDVRMAGYGLNHSGALGCTCATAGCSPVQYYYNGTYSSPPAASSTMPPIELVPVVIAKTAGQPDKITMVYGSAPVRSLPGKLEDDMTTPSAVLKGAGVVGYEKDDLLVLADGGKCSIMQVTDKNEGTSQIIHNSGVSKWNRPGGGNQLPKYAKGAQIFDLGTPTWRSYSIASGRMQVTDLIGAGAPSTTAQNLVDDIVDLRAQYGKDDGAGGTATPDDGIVDTWDNNKPTDATEWGRLLAIRVAVLARSPNYVKPLVPGANCDATTATPTWSGGNFDALDFATGTSEARCYKYRVFETVVPLRNMIWRPS